jgi:hypothetical protein
LKRIAIAFALATTMLSGTAFAASDDLPDYTDKAITCDKDVIKEQMASMLENGPAGKLGIRLLYIKGDPVETARSKDELRCRIVAVTNVNTMKGIIRFYNEDEQSLVRWTANGSK